MLGWVYNALFLGILISYLKDSVNSKKYNLIFLITQAAVIGMTISFAIQGYAAVSISFSTLHIISEYAFIYCFVKDIRAGYNGNNLISLKFIYGGLFFLFVSSLGPWGLAVIGAMGIEGSDIYKLAVYFYLHFQYNGWFVFALTGLWIANFEDYLDINEKTKLVPGFYLLFFSDIPAYFLSILNLKTGAAVRIIAIACAVAQLIGIRLIYPALFAAQKRLFNDKSVWSVKLFRLSILALLVKFVLQLLISMPGAGEPAFISREVTIAFIHLVMLGVVTPGLIAWFGYNKIVEPGTKSALILYFTGFFVSEILLFYPSLVIWFRAPVLPYYSIILFAVTLVILVSVVMIFYTVIKKNNLTILNS
jgi:hypothetical protein